MKMINTPAAVLPSLYPSYVHNCLRNRACEPPYLAPLPGVPYLQLYVDYGTTKPVTMEFNIIDTCTGNTEQIFPSNWVAGKNPDGTWYGVFKYFNTPALPVTSFVVWLSSFVENGFELEEKTFFSEMLVVEPCAPLTKIKACQPAGATITGFDVNGVYYGTPVNVDYLGIAEIRYFHIAWVRLGKVRELSNKATFKSSLVANFRTSVEKLHQLETELVPKWYKDELLAIYARGVVEINDLKKWLVSDLTFEALNDDDLTWKPFAQLKETFRLYFGCDDSECVECCSPLVIIAVASVDGGNRIEIDFTPCEPTPVNGYRVSYRKIGGGTYTVHPVNFTTTPAIIVDNSQPPGTSYEGYIQGDCGNGKFGVSIPWTAINEDAPSQSLSGSGSDCVPVEFDGAPPTMPEAIIGQPYLYQFPIIGTAPFTVVPVDVPSWPDFNIAVVGNMVQVSGTPNAPASPETVHFEIYNCGNPEAAIVFNQTFDVPVSGSLLVISHNVSVSITDLSDLNPGGIVFPVSGTADSGTWKNFAGPVLNVGLSTGGSGFVSLFKNAGLVQKIPYSGASVAFLGVAPFAAGDNIRVQTSAT